jgi:hypothetical protein
MSGAIPPLPNTPPWRGAKLKHRDTFTFTFHILICNFLKIKMIIVFELSQIYSYFIKILISVCCDCIISWSCSVYSLTAGITLELHGFSSVTWKDSCKW